MPSPQSSSSPTTRHIRPQRALPEVTPGPLQTLVYRSALTATSRSPRSSAAASSPLDTGPKPSQSRSIKQRNRRKTEEPDASTSASVLLVDDAGRFLIAVSGGDLLLDVHRTIEPDSEHFTYLVSSAALVAHSAFFARLLDPDKFGEGTRVAQQRKSLEERYGSSNCISFIDDGNHEEKVGPIAELPTVVIYDVGQISAKVASISGLMADFLYMLHGQPLSAKMPPLTNLANLVIVADRFDALLYMEEYIRDKSYLAVYDAKFTTDAAAATGGLAEEKVRQALFIGLMLGRERWVAAMSRALIVSGSKRWKEDEDDGDMDMPMWWDIPQGVEAPDELIFRRTRVFDTLSSIPSHFLQLYTNTLHKCKLGYENSTQCDSFQLGEMVKFFARTGVLNFSPDASADFDSNPLTSATSNPLTLISTLRQCPSYQIDRNHYHCGLRIRLIPILDLLESALLSAKWVGVCLQCWREQRKEYAWSTAKGPLVWTRQMLFVGSRVKELFNERKGGGGTVHVSLREHCVPRDMFLAGERDWSMKGD